MKMFIYIFTLVTVAFGIFGIANAHPGRTDSSGGHTCRTNCPSWGLSYGEYHYHGGYTVPKTPITLATPIQNTKQFEDHKANVRMLYWALFNRGPENENVVEAKANKHGDIRKVAEEMLGSAEFRQKNASLFK